MHWELISPDANTKFSEGDISLPTLTPASQWSGKIHCTIPAEEYVLEVSIIRPTGFSVIERSYDEKGKQLP
jgi:hypothetical protein